MALRGFGNQTIGASAQPLLGTTTTAAVQPSPDPYSGNTNPASQPSKTVLPVTNVNLFRRGDHIQVGVVADFETGTPDGGTVVNVDTVGSTITVMGLVRSHASGEFVVLAIPCAQVQIQVPSSDTGASILVGEDPTVASNSTKLIVSIAKGTIYPIGGNVPGNVLETQRLWVSGTAADVFLPSILTV